MSILLPPRWSLEGKKALVTGGTRGIGKAIAEELLLLGAEAVLIIARKKEEVAETVKEWQREGFTAFGLASDVGNSEHRRLIATWIEDNWQYVDVLVNNVGTNLRKKTIDYTEEEYAFLLQTNLTSVFEMSRLCYPLLKAAPKKPATVVNIASVAGITHLRTGSVYAMCKAAMLQLTRNLAVEWATDGIRVNAVVPWYTNTPLAQQVLDNPQFLAEVLQRTPLGRIAEPHEVAAAVAFLCLPASGYITGQALCADGGFSIFGF
ncbi:KR domain-containing protein [Sphingobacteriales bacterium UPWRP_1]|nr:tropinone reductase [Sphingobacteriales bacterium TSM_CSS]PSJ77358.1 KR domain-containing protein [Sphingobacteriales bacterium UPWRP_1]